jgi:hypothetical protein
MIALNTGAKIVLVHGGPTRVFNSHGGGEEYYATDKSQERFFKIVDVIDPFGRDVVDAVTVVRTGTGEITIFSGAWNPETKHHQFEQVIQVMAFDSASN